MAFLFYHGIVCDTPKTSRDKNLIVEPLQIQLSRGIEMGSQTKISTMGGVWTFTGPTQWGLKISFTIEIIQSEKGNTSYGQM